MHQSPEEIASRLFREVPDATVSGMTQWIVSQVGISDPDQVRAIIELYWRLQDQQSAMND